MVIEWGSPFPRVHYNLLFAPDNFVVAFKPHLKRARSLPQPIVTTRIYAYPALANESDEFVLRVLFQGEQVIISRVAMRVTPLLDTGKVLLRPDHALVPVVGSNLFLIEDVQPTEGHQVGFVKGQDVPILENEPESLLFLAPSLLQAVSELRKAFDFAESLDEMMQQTQITLAAQRAGLHSDVITTLSFNTIKEAKVSLAQSEKEVQKGDIIAAAGYLFNAMLLHSYWANMSVWKTLYELMKNSPHGIAAADYINACIDMAIHCATFTQELQKIVEKIRETDLKHAQVAGLRRIQEEVEERLKELGVNNEANEISQLKAQLERKQLPEQVRAYIVKELQRLDVPYSMHWAETDVVLKHIRFLLSLPWYERATEMVSLEEVAVYLDRSLYGLRIAKEAVLDYLSAVHASQGKGKVKGMILCFVGPPGTGKTDMARRIAEALKRPFYKIALGGVNDEAEIKGHRRTYVGALPGSIAKALSIVGVKNPVILLDEVDKMHIGLRGDPAAALMEALDPEFNHSFYDHFVDFPLDLSEVLFICSANVEENIPAPLRDRMQIIPFRPYTATEKFVIAKEYILPRVQSELGLDASPQFTEEAIKNIISYYTFESGVRELSRLLRKAVMRNLRYKFEVIDVEQVDKLLWDEPKMVWRYHKHSSFGVGAVPTLGVSEGTGEGIVDVLMFRTIGEENSEGAANNENNLGDKILFTFESDNLTQQTIRLAILYARMLVGKQPMKWIVHQTNPSVRTIGTSLGVSAVLGALSALLGKVVHPDSVFTGEIDCYGNIHAVGGIATKIAAAEMCGYKRIYLPKANEHDLLALDFTPQIEVRLVSHLREILDDGILLDSNGGA